MNQFNLLLLTLVLFFTIGCSYDFGVSASYCKEQGYKGIANYKDSKIHYCSNNEIIGNLMLTSYGEKPLETQGRYGGIKLIFTEFK